MDVKRRELAEPSEAEPSEAAPSEAAPRKDGRIVAVIYIRLAKVSIAIAAKVRK